MFLLMVGCAVLLLLCFCYASDGGKLQLKIDTTREKGIDVGGFPTSEPVGKGNDIFMLLICAQYFAGIALP